jgi:hypothetical protein
MDENDRDESAKQVSIHDLKIDPAAEDLMDSPAMRPYATLAFAAARPMLGLFLEEFFA